MPFHKTGLRLVVAVVLGTLSGLASMYLARFDFLKDMERRTTDLRFRAFPAKLDEEPNVVLVPIDDASISYLQKKGKSWPFRWMIHELVLDFISKGDPAAICFDVVFRRKPVGRDQERELGYVKDTLEGVRDIQPVVPVYQDMKNPADTPEKLLPSSWRNRWHHLSEKLPDPEYNILRAPIEEFLNAADGAGSVVVNRDPDGVLRRISLFNRVGESVVPSLAMSAAATKGGRSAKLKREGQFYQLKFAGRNIQLDEDGNLPLCWYNPRAFPRHSYLDIFKARRDELEADDAVTPEDFSDKIVLIGASFSVKGKDSPLDVVSTPTTTKLAGVEAQATAVENLLSGPNLTYPPPWVVYGITIFVSVLVAVTVAWFVRVRWELLFAVLAFIAYGGTAVELFRRFYLVLPMATPAAGGFSALLLTGFFQYFTEGLRRERIRRNFGKMVPESILEDLETNFDLARAEVGETRELTVLFADIRGFTEFSDDHNPEEVVDYLNHHFDEMLDSLLTHEGTFDKYMGDGFLGYFGAPQRIDQPERKAVRAALEMKRKTREIPNKLSIPHPSPVRIGVGIHTGPTVVGFMGGQEFVEYTPIGEGVNLASRLEGLNKKFGTDILISDRTKERVDDEFVTRSLGWTSVKGVERKVMVHEVLCRFGENEKLEKLADEFNAGVTSYRDGNYERAMDCFLSCLSIQPEDDPSVFWMDRVSEKREGGDEKAGRNDEE